MLWISPITTSPLVYNFDASLSIGWCSLVQISKPLVISRVDSTKMSILALQSSTSSYNVLNSLKNPCASERTFLHTGATIWLYTEAYWQISFLSSTKVVFEMKSSSDLGIVKQSCM